MTDIKKGNFAYRDPNDEEIPDGSVIYGGMFRQHTPETKIMVGRKLTILGGNWVNVIPDPNWIIGTLNSKGRQEGGGMWYKRELCANKHPELVERGLAPEPVNCPHAELIEIIIDGEDAVEPYYEYEDGEPF